MTVRALEEKIIDPWAQKRWGHNWGCLLTGCWDVLTRGHVGFLTKAASIASPVIVGVNDDESVCKLKGPHRPIYNEQDRMIMLAALEMVDYVFLIRSTNVAEAILKVGAAYWVKGGDYTMETLNPQEVAAAKHIGAEIIILPRIGDYSTTEVIHKLQTVVSNP